MNPLMIYMVKAGISFSTFYLIYILTLSKDTLYLRNRFYLLGSVLISLILPFIVIRSDVPVAGLISEVLVYGSGSNLPVRAEKNYSPAEIINLVYMTGVIFFALKLIIDILEIMILVSGKIDKGNKIIFFNSRNTSGFSAMGHIFIKEGLNPAEQKEIIRHEQHHIDQGHFADIMFFEIFRIFQWFNPVVYFAGRSLRAVHEYQADECCLKKMEITSYQKLLINQIFNSRIFELTNCFSNPTLLKKRMTMMTRERSDAVVNIKLLLIVPVIALLLTAFSSEKVIQDENASPYPISRQSSAEPPEVLPPPPENQSKPRYPEIRKAEPEPFVVVEEMPLFPGGQRALMEYVNSNIRYPVAAKEKVIQGRVIVRFAVNSQGKVEKVSVLKGVDAELDNEAIRVVENLPDFTPGRQGGKAVPVWYMIPITFTLK